MIEALVGALVVAVGAAYWLLIHRTRARKRSPQPKTRMAQLSKAGGRFGSVQIRMRGGACVAARALEGQRFLAKDAPSLPLSDCTSGQCSCSFTKLSDRRTDGRRLEQGGLSASLFIATNRRTRRDRRRPAPSER